MIESCNPNNENRPFAPLMGSLSPELRSFEVHSHVITNLRAASTLELPELGSLRSIARKNTLEVTLEDSPVLNWRIDNARILDTQLFTVPKLSGVEIWVGGFVRPTENSSERYHYFKQLGKAKEIHADEEAPSTFKALEPFTSIRTNEGRFPKASTRVSSGATKTLFFLADYTSVNSNKGTDVWHCHASSDQFIQNQTFPGSVRSFDITSDPQRIALGYQGGGIAVRKMSSGGRIAEQNLFKVRLIDLGFSGGSFATSLSFIAQDPSKPTNRNLLLVGTNRGEVAALGLDDPTQTQVVATESLARIRHIETDSSGTIHTYSDEK